MKFRRYRNRLRVSTTINGVQIQEYIPIGDDIEAAQEKAEERYQQLRMQSTEAAHANLLEPRLAKGKVIHKPWLIAPNFACTLAHEKLSCGKIGTVAPEIYIRYYGEDGKQKTKRFRLSVNGGVNGAFPLAAKFYARVYRLNDEQINKLRQRTPPATVFYEELLDKWIARHGNFPRLRQSVIDATQGITRKSHLDI